MLIVQKSYPVADNPSSRFFKPTAHPEASVHMSFSMSLQVASSEELLPASNTTVILHVEMNRKDVSLHHGSAVFPLKLPDAEPTFSRLLAVLFYRLDVVV